MRFRLETDTVDDTWFLEDVHLGDNPTLTVTRLVRGQQVSWRVYGFNPSEFVGIYYALQGEGMGPCVLGGGVCFGVLDPTLINNNFLVSTNGVTDITLTFPPALPLIPIWSQALLIRFPLPTSVLSNVAVRTIE